MKIFGVGVSGLVGSRITEVLHNKYTFTNLSSDTGIDITDPSTLAVIREDNEHDVVFHLAAKADVDGCEKDKPLGKTGAAYKINVTGTENVVEACRAGKKKIVYVSTDFVFDGENPPEHGYTEDDTPHPINWYAETKYLGEEIVRKSGIPFVIMRIANPYRSGESPASVKQDFVHIIRDRLNRGESTKGVTDQIISPTYIDDIAQAFDILIQKEVTGIFHVFGSQCLSPYEVVQKIADRYGLDKNLIHKTTNEEFNKGRAPRPFKLQTNNDKIKKLGVTMRTFDEGLKELV
jgi:dTDP-4-dehydrorhamnose reductase